MKAKIPPDVTEAASELFRKRGYASVHMEDIAKELGISKKNLYQHVESKEALLLEICFSWHQNLKQHFHNILDNKKLSLKEKLFLHTEYCSTKLNRLHSSFFLDIKRHCPAIYPKLLQFRRDGVIHTITALLRQGQKEGIVRKNISLPLVTESYLSVMFNIMEPETLNDLNLTPSQAIKQILEFFFNGVLILTREAE